MHKRKKYNVEFKLKLVKEILRGKGSANGLSNLYGVPRFLIRKWIDQYQADGQKGLEPRGYKIYPIGFKLNVIESYYREKLTLRECCMRFDMPSQSTLISWLKKYNVSGQASFREKRGRPKSMKADKSPKSKSQSLTRPEELEKENLYLRAENELLKKLEALTQRKVARRKKKH